MHGVGAQAKATRTMNWREHDRWARIAIPPGPISPPAARARARALADRYLLLQFGMQPAGHARARAGDPPPDALMTATYGEPAQHAAAAPPYPRRLALSLGQTLPFCSVLAGHTGWKNVNIPQARATTYDSNTHTNNWQGRALRHTYVELGRQGCSMIGAHARARSRDRASSTGERESSSARAARGRGIRIDRGRIGGVRTCRGQYLAKEWRLRALFLAATGNFFSDAISGPEWSQPRASSWRVWPRRSSLRCPVLIWCLRLGSGHSLAMDCDPQEFTNHYGERWTVNDLDRVHCSWELSFRTYIIVRYSQL